MHRMEELKEMLCDKLDEYVDNRRLNTTSELDSINKLTDSIKNTLKIGLLEQASEQADGYYSNRYSGNRSYDRGSSYARRRDNMGRYTRDYSSRYIRDDEKDDMTEKIQDMMNATSDEKEREALRCAMNALKNA